MAKSSLELTLESGQKHGFEVDSCVAQAVAKHHADGGVFFAIEGNEFFSVDFKNVLAVHGSPSQGEMEAPKGITITSPLVGTNTVAPSRTGFLTASPQDGRDVDKALYKLECSCGASYFAKMYAETERCRCRQCNEQLFVDKFAPKQYGDNKEQATLATNKYKVPFVNGNDIA